ncbi:AAA family ATPase [Chitinophaga polysaccharea]|uniref:AAA family ATPase n=1 Tax=Chitinophaga polysaccharea TaxID=1293035 RepID=UPI0014553C9B|nr:ATP-binding protein [Chitinophaga polysaccharea]NLR59038.1 AAA family ATPase [Chitinophaga polysaccharea]
MEKLIGRQHEKKILLETLSSSEAELVAVYGRRRVGKTFLVRQVYQDHMAYEFSGVHGSPAKQQLENFRNAIALTLNTPVLPAIPHNWTEAFLLLIQLLSPQLKKKKMVIFFDEFPWLSAAKSGFLPAFEYFWNSWGSKQANLVVTICGSAASWMIQRVVNNKGGLHNRITRKIRLLPFDLQETAAYLKSRSVNLDHYQTLQVYMALGGIPHYLKEIRKGESATQAIDRLCFTKDGLLVGEFSNLYNSLFEMADRHIAVVKALAAKPSGLTRNEIIHEAGLQSGGTTTKLLEELVQSGFTAAYLPFGKNAKDLIYKLADEYSLFYLKFVEHSRATGPGTWIRRASSPSWKSWSGMAFENICLKHTPQIKQALGIASVYTEESAWRSKTAQIDLLLDRQDGCINICEMKFSNTTFTIEKSYATELQRKLANFQDETGTRKTLFLTMITSYGVKDNQYKNMLIHHEITMEELFK